MGKIRISVLTAGLLVLALGMGRVWAQGQAGDKPADRALDPAVVEGLRQANSLVDRRAYEAALQALAGLPAAALQDGRVREVLLAIGGKMRPIGAQRNTILAALRACPAGAKAVGLGFVLTAPEVGGLMPPAPAQAKPANGPASPAGGEVPRVPAPATSPASAEAQ